MGPDRDGPRLACEWACFLLGERLKCLFGNLTRASFIILLPATVYTVLYSPYWYCDENSAPGVNTGQNLPILTHNL